MMNQRIVVGMLVAFVPVLFGCTPSDNRPQPSSTNPAPHVVALSATEYTFEAPDSIAPGWTTFTMANHGQVVHYGHVVQLAPGKTVEEMVTAYAEAIRTSGPRPTWVTRFGGPGGTAPGSTSNVTQYLEPGSYVWICPVEDESGHPHFAKGEFKQFVVSAAAPGAAPRARAPEASTVVRLEDYSFAVDSLLRAGRQLIRVENTGAQPHDLVLMKLAPGRTLNDIVTWMNPENARRAGRTGEPMPSLESLGTGLGGIAAIAPGMEVFFEAELSPGEYVLICMATAPDGRSHIEHGMIQQVRVR